MQAEPELQLDTRCELHILEQHVNPFDLVLAFRKDFYDMWPGARALKAAVDTELLGLLEDGTLWVRDALADPGFTVSLAVEVG